MDQLIGLFGVSESDGGERKGVLNDFNTKLEPEVEEGNVEFKLKLVDPTPERLEHLITQMKWRLREGNGEAIYEIGVEDDGGVIGLLHDELSLSLANLNKMAHRLQADTTIIREVLVDAVSNRKAVEVLVRKIPSDKPFIDIRVCVLGSVDAGKSTLIGVLTTRELDNGRGRARLNLFRHLHEMQSGHTSSISHDILGFDSTGTAMDYSNMRSKEEICESSSKLLTLIDLPGGQKSLKTTIFGLTGYCPDVAFVAHAANNLSNFHTTREHFGLAMALNIPCVMIITKCDLTPGHRLVKVRDTVRHFLQLPGIGKFAFFVHNETDAIQAAGHLMNDSVTPVFCISCVGGGEGVHLLAVLLKFMNFIPKLTSQKETDRLCKLQPEFRIDETFSIPTVGCVVGGVMRRGVVRQKDVMHLGPYEDGSFKPVRVASIQRNHAACSVVKTNECAALALDGHHVVRKGMVLLSAPEGEPQLEDCSGGADVGADMGATPPGLAACVELKAEVLVLHHPTKICVGFQCTLHIDNIVQTAIITKIEPDEFDRSAPPTDYNSKGLQTNDKGKVSFRFIKQCEFIRPGMRLLFREGYSKGIGHITSITPFTQS